MTRVFVLGGTGKTGSQVVSLIQNNHQRLFTLTKDLSQCDVVIEFSNPTACLEHLKKTSNEVLWVIGSTGWSKDQESELLQLSKSRLILKASNFSLGVSILNTWLEHSAGILHTLGFTVSMSEIHHAEKKDAPSGTALTLKNQLEQSGFKNIKIDSTREGDAVGTHTLRFEAAGEILTLEHKAKNRAVFAHGAIEAARWLTKLRALDSKKTGLLSMHEFMQSN